MMKRTTFFILMVLLGATFTLAACDAAVPGAEPEATESEETTTGAGLGEEAGETSDVSQTEGAAGKTIFVGPELVECEGEGPQQCMLVKEDLDGEYMLYYSPIEGFNFEPGYEYELIVREEPVENPPAGGSSIKWTLVEEVSKTPVDATTTSEETDASGRIVAAFVGPELVDCVGVAPQKCMQVKTNPDDDYSFFYDTIDGFEYEEGYEYELRVLVEPVQDPPADAPALTYTLIETVSKTPITTEQPAVGEIEVGGELTLVGPTWLLDSYVDLAGQVAQTMPDSRVTIVFEPDQVAGSAGCNNYFGPYDVDGNALTIGPLGSTMKMCAPEELMLQETGYLANLGNVAGYEIVNDQLHLLDAGGQTLLTYREDQQVSLTRTVWTVTGYNNGKGGVTSVVINTEMTAIFTEDDTVGGSAGCNDYRAGFETDGNNISIGPAAVTRKFCVEPEGIMDQEALFLAALEIAATFEIDGARMDLYDEDGSRVATLNASEFAEQTFDETVEIPVTASDEGFTTAAEDGVEKTIYIGPELLDCVGVAPQKCLQVKEDPDDEYQFHYSAIEGFDFEPGYEYELIILEEAVENPPADASSLKWTLVEEVSKTPVEDTTGEPDAGSAESAELAGTSWQWLQMTTPVEEVTIEDPSKYNLEFLADGAVSIVADCNNGSGTYEASGGSISIKITSTSLALCEEDSFSDLFIRSLNVAAIYFEQDGDLFLDLFADAGTMQFTPN